MTKKDYIKIANVFRAQNDFHWVNNSQSDTGRLYGLLIENMCDMLQKDNSNFDRVKFIKYITN